MTLERNEAKFSVMADTRTELEPKKFDVTAFQYYSCISRRWIGNTSIQTLKIIKHEIFSGDPHTVLKRACYRGCVELLRFLIEKHGYDPVSGEIDTLHQACNCGYLDIVRYLIEDCKCDPMCRNNEGFTPLHEAVSNGQLHIVQYLVEYCRCHVIDDG